MAERPRELGDFKKARVNGGTDNHSLKTIEKMAIIAMYCNLRPPDAIAIAT